MDIDDSVNSISTNEPVDDIKADAETEKFLIGIEKFDAVLFSDLLLNELRDIEPLLSHEKYAQYILQD